LVCAIRVPQKEATHMSKRNDAYSRKIRIHRAVCCDEKSNRLASLRVPTVHPVAR
jgi:hypothetical protein